MKLISSYIKEMKIAARGFYFYIEIFMAVLILIILLVAVKEYPESKQKEFIYYQMPEQIKENIINQGIKEGSLVLMKPTEFKIKASEFEVESKETGTKKSMKFDAETITLQTYKVYSLEKEILEKTIYIAENEEQVIRLAFGQKKIASTISIDEEGKSSFRYYTQGYETKKLNNLLYMLHSDNGKVLSELIETQKITKLGRTTILNNRENMVPVMVVLLGSLMGFFIVIAYVFLDKDEGVIRAFAVTPSSIWQYLLSKTMVIITTVTISSSIITIPIMKLQPNYLLFYTLLIISSFTFSSLGLLVASFFDNISNAFGILYIIVIILMLPALSYFLPSFNPFWIRALPTYPILQSMKEIIMVKTDVGYVIGITGIVFTGGVILFLLANLRFKKTLTA